MFLNLETDYAIRIVYYLSGCSAKTDAKTIAEATGVTQRFTLKILHKLVASEIVKSFKGANGGYMLARPAEEITLLQVVEQVFGPLTISQCQKNEGECTHPDGICCFRGVFDDVSGYMRDKFSKVTFKKEE